jgi:hypothetical protein
VANWQRGVVDWVDRVVTISSNETSGALGAANTTRSRQPVRKSYRLDGARFFLACLKRAAASMDGKKEKKKKRFLLSEVARLLVTNERLLN